MAKCANRYRSFNAGNIMEKMNRIADSQTSPSRNSVQITEVIEKVSVHTYSRVSLMTGRVNPKNRQTEADTIKNPIRIECMSLRIEFAKPD